MKFTNHRNDYMPSAGVPPLLRELPQTHHQVMHVPQIVQNSSTSIARLGIVELKAAKLPGRELVSGPQAWRMKRCRSTSARQMWIGRLPSALWTHTPRDRGKSLMPGATNGRRHAGDPAVLPGSSSRSSALVQQLCITSHRIEVTSQVVASGSPHRVPVCLHCLRRAGLQQAPAIHPRSALCLKDNIRHFFHRCTELLQCLQDSCTILQGPA
jgi:hypothetical protein